MTRHLNGKFDKEIVYLIFDVNPAVVRKHRHLRKVFIDVENAEKKASFNVFLFNLNAIIMGLK